MKVRILVYILFLISLSAVCAQGNQIKSNSQAQSQVDALIAKLANGKIVRVEVLQIPPDVLTRVGITPEALERSFFYKFTIRDMRGGRYSEGMLKAMESVMVQEQTDMPDLRWGVIFYDIDDNRVGAIYFNKWGSGGAVGDVPVSFKGDLFKWLKRNFSKCFR
jgi:hypothetical protein